MAAERDDHQALHLHLLCSIMAVSSDDIDDKQLDRPTAYH